MNNKIFCAVFSVLILFITLSAQAADQTDQGGGNEDSPDSKESSVDQSSVDYLIDFNKVAAQGSMEENPYHNDNWLLELVGSSDFIANRNTTDAKDVKDVNGKSHIGVRINFPNYPNNSYASLKPPVPFDFSLSGDEKGLGVLKNVEVIRKIIVKVAGRFFPHYLYLSLEDVNGKVSSYKIARLDFYGWEEKEWINKNYITDSKDRVEALKGFKISPYYPRLIPSVKLSSIRFFRDGENLSGDFISYVSWVKIAYNKTFDPDILKTLEKFPDDAIEDDESVWGIEAARGRTSSIDDDFESFKLRKQIDKAKSEGVDLTKN